MQIKFAFKFVMHKLKSLVRICGQALTEFYYCWILICFRIFIK